MKAKIFPSVINGSVHAPPSKSGTQRAFAAALLHTGATEIINAGTSNDERAAVAIITALGAVVTPGHRSCKVQSAGMVNNIPLHQIIHCGESGLALRMFAPIAAISNDELILTGEGSLGRRPMHFFDRVFPQLGITVQSAAGHLPLKIKGPLQPCDIEVDGSLSSQFLTGLLLAFGAVTRKEVVITVNDLKSKPYIDLTLAVMKDFGYDIIHDQYRRFVIHPKKETVEKISYTVEGDWSGASFLLVAGALAGKMNVSGLKMSSSQADKAILDVLMECGAEVNISANNICVGKNNLRPFRFDATDCPDLFPPLVALAAYCPGISVISGTSRLAAKESDRAIALRDVFGKMGVKITLSDDQMIIAGGGAISGGNISSHHDHRIAMAAAVAALGAQAELLIEHAEAINKSYPRFFADLETAGASTAIIESYI